MHEGILRRWRLGLLAVILMNGCSDIPFGLGDSEAEEEKVVTFVEQEQALPAYPRSEDLLPLDIDEADGAFDYAIDSRSLSTSADGIVRYTVVITSDSGVKNVLHEGIRCGAKQFKTFALGSDATAFQPLKNPLWREIRRKGIQLHYFELFTYYLCDTTQFPLKPKQIVQRLRYSDSIPASPNPYN